MRDAIEELRDRISELEDENRALKTKKKSSKTAPPNPALAALESTIENRGRFYTTMFGPWFTTAALDTPLPDFNPACDLFRPARFTNPAETVRAEAEQIYTVFYLIPADPDGTCSVRDNILAIAGRSPFFYETVHHIATY